MILFWRKGPVFEIGLLGYILFSVAGVGAEEPWKLTLEKYCLECHDSLAEEGDFNMEAVLDGDRASHFDDWVKILNQVDGRQMPPAGEDRPDEAAYEEVAANLVGFLDELAAAFPNPGRTDTIRRLTRTEYQNAIRDLLALDVDVSELLPADASSHGFDNVTVGDLSPALLDGYIRAARKISRLAMGGGSGDPDERSVRIRPDVTQEVHVEGLPLGTRGGALIPHYFPEDGEYEVRILLTRDRNEMIEGLSRTHQLEVLLDGAPVATIEVSPPKNRRDHTKVDSNLTARFRVKAGPGDLGVTFRKTREVLEETLRQPYEAHFNFHRHPRLSPAIFQVSILGPFEASGVESTPSRQRIFSTPAGQDLSGEKYARVIIQQLLRRAWRRPVDESDVDRLMTFFEAGQKERGTFDGGIEEALSAVLVSPEFLLKVERDPEGIEPGTPYPLSDLELASRLSFFLWSSIPDDELLEVAEQGVLRKPEVLERQVRRMLVDSRSRSLVTNFADQWLYLRNLDSITPDGRLFPGFDDNLRQAFRRETEWLFERMLREEGGVLDLLTSDETFLNERLAKHYGIPHVYGSRFRRVKLEEGSHRGGLLRHGSILTVTSYATRTSPVIRGSWILENILGDPPPPPPPNIPALEDNVVLASLPIRERLAVHREKASCANCHDLIDPVGFALENFDAVGRWRAMDGGAPVDARGGLPDGNEFEGVAGLEAGILHRPEMFVRTLTEKLLIYALGRGVESYDAPTVRRVVMEAAENNYRFSDVVVGLVLSDPFTMRMSESEGSTVSQAVH